MKLFARQYIKYWLIALVAVAVAVFATYRSYTKKKNQKLEQQKRATDAESDRTYKVKREDLPIGLIQGGTVNAVNVSPTSSLTVLKSSRNAKKLLSVSLMKWFSPSTKAGPP